MDYSLNRVYLVYDSTVFNARHMVVTVHDVMASQKDIKPNSVMEAIKKRYMNQYLKVYMEYEGCNNRFI